MAPTNGMAEVQPLDHADTDAAERRRHKRTQLTLLGRYMLPDRREFPCQVRNISAGGMLIICPEPGETGDKIIAYIDEIGRVEGVVARIEKNTAAIQFTVSKPKQEKIVETLTWLLNHHHGEAEEGRRHRRMALESGQSHLELSDGRTYPCEVIDISMGGASVKVSVAPKIGSEVTLGKMRGRVVRLHEEGVAIQFVDVPHSGSIADHFGKADSH